ncbi:hypothetical protein SNEBB_007001 [Seison nebaliae]|nr:hypothetical protein SNEBB_007001 [Seison nebaliae]
MFINVQLQILFIILSSLLPHLNALDIDADIHQFQFDGFPQSSLFEAIHRLKRYEKRVKQKQLLERQMNEDDLMTENKDKFSSLFLAGESNPYQWNKYEYWKYLQYSSVTKLLSIQLYDNSFLIIKSNGIVDTDPFQSEDASFILQRDCSNLTYLLRSLANGQYLCMKDNGKIISKNTYDSELCLFKLYSNADNTKFSLCRMKGMLKNNVFSLKPTSNSTENGEQYIQPCIRKSYHRNKIVNGFDTRLYSSSTEIRLVSVIFQLDHSTPTFVSTTMSTLDISEYEKKKKKEKFSKTRTNDLADKLLAFKEAEEIRLCNEMTKKFSNEMVIAGISVSIFFPSDSRGRLYERKEQTDPFPLSYNMTNKQERSISSNVKQLFYYVRNLSTYRRIVSRLQMTGKLRNYIEKTYRLRRLHDLII